jgi:hypothetical protein
VAATNLNQAASQTSQERIDSMYSSEADRSGWLFFAGSIMGLAGLMRIVDSVWAFSYKGALPEHLQDGVLGSNVENYAWLWLIVGVVILISSFFVLTRSELARWVGYFAAAIMAVSAITWMPYYPVWSLMYVGIAVLVFYALARYGGRDPV